MLSGYTRQPQRTARRDWTPPSPLPGTRGLAERLGFSKNTGCQGDAEPRGERGGLNDTVGFQFCELIIAGFFQKCLLVKVGLSLAEAPKKLPFTPVL